MHQNQILLIKNKKGVFMYQVIMFDRSVNDFYVLNTSEDYATCVQEAISHIYKEIDRWNQLNIQSRLDYVEYDEILEIF